MQSKSRVHADPSRDEIDQFDRIPDSMVIVILNKVADVRYLVRCSAVSKRFNSLVPLVQDVYVRIDRVVSSDDDADDILNPSFPKPHSLFSHFLKFMLFTLLKPFHNQRNTNVANRLLFQQVSQHSPGQVLKNFTQIRNLMMELPAGDVVTEEGVVLKWRAEFGSSLHNCTVLGGTRADGKPASADHGPSVEDNGGIPESLYMNGGLKLRVVWSISSLIAASTRHYLLIPIIKDHPTLRTLVLTDADGQGTLVMGSEQLREAREKPVAASATSSRTLVPACSMKLRYSPYMELPDGMGLQGATLVAIKPSSEGGSVSSTGKEEKEESEALICGAFNGPFTAAENALVKRRTYLLEMNGF